jgi:Ni,Fe-hydrogenase maturation factor
MKTILCFGNEFVKSDALAKEMAEELIIEGVEFIKCDNLNDVLDREGEVYILDVAKGITEIKLFDDISKINTNSIISLHDFDLGYFLKLMKEIGKIEKINIIAMPINYDKEKAKEEIRKLLTTN